MELLVRPLALPQINWEEWIKTTQEIVGGSPTRGLDKEQIDIKDPAAWLSTLDFTNRGPLEVLRGGPNGLFQHYSLSFLFLLESEGCLELSVQTQLHVHAIPAKRRGYYLCVVSGTLKAWHDAILHFCKAARHMEMREIFNAVVAVFDHSHLKQILHRYKRKILTDGTFEIQ
jgi:hypothetical protein